MKHCVNCATKYAPPCGLCPKCHLDPRIPEEVIDRDLSTRQGSHFHPRDVPIGYPGEVAALRLAIFASIVTFVLLGAVTFGFFIVVLGGSLLTLGLRQFNAKGSMITVSEKNFETVWKLTKLAAFRLRMPLPAVYITQDQSYNAHTVGFYTYGFIVINSAMVRDFKPAELLFVIGHEVGHMKCHHTTWLNLLQPGRAGSARFLFAPLMRIIFNIWSVKGEYTADQAGLVACDNLAAACGGLLKLAGGDAVEQQVADPAGFRDGAPDSIGTISEYFGTHPFIHNRVHHLRAFAASRCYRSLRWWDSPGHAQRES
jgi:Zn-dependent protease with chaperone function